MAGSMLASASRILWRLLEAHNLDPKVLFLASGLNPEYLKESRIRYPAESVFKAWIEAARVIGDPSIGLEATKFYNPLDLGALGVSFLSSSTLMAALQRLHRYESVLHSNLDFTIVESEERVDILSAARVSLQECVMIAEDFRMSIMLDLCRQGLSQPLNPVEVAFTYHEPKNTKKHAATFRCPLAFAQPVARISFSTEDTRRTFAALNRELALGNDRILDGLLAELNASDLVSQVKRIMVENLPSGTPTEADISKRVCMSDRTLQRKLAEEGTNFRSLLLDVRRELAERYISDKQMPLAEISYMLGFADQSSFQRAFKKWTGDSPALFRSNLA